MLGISVGFVMKRANPNQLGPSNLETFCPVRDLGSNSAKPGSDHRIGLVARPGSKKVPLELVYP